MEGIQMEGIQEKHELSVDFHHPVEENQTGEQKLGLGFQNPNLDDQTLDHQLVCDQEDGLSQKLHEMGIEDKEGLIGEKNDEVSEKNDVESDMKDSVAEDEENDTKGEAKGEESEGKEENGGGFKEVKEWGVDKEGSRWSEIEEEEEENNNYNFEVKKDEGVAGEKEYMNEYDNGWDEKWNNGAGRNEVNEGQRYFDNYENESYRKEKYDGEARWFGNVEGDSVGLNDGNNGSFHYPLRPDAEDCSYYMRTGTCKYGSTCKFNHPLRRKNQAARDMLKQTEEIFDRPGPTECKYHFTPGGCKYGKACRYNHGRAKPPLIQDFNFLGLPIRVGERECPYYMRTSSCKYGSNCRFNHPDPTVVGGGDSASQGSIKDTTSGWSSARTLNENAPFMPVIYPPSPSAPPNAKWNGYQAPVYPTSERNLPTPPAFSLRPMNVPATDSNFYAYPRQQLIVDEFPERPGQPECDYYLKTGDCKYRSTCKFHHPRNRKTSFTLSEQGLPLRPDQSICSHYSRYGICKYGPACKYDHSVTNGSSAESDQGHPPRYGRVGNADARYGRVGNADGNWRREPMQQSV